jgi:pSer/pThr/pTyr-binding forkhead associated (FHA) protein
MSTLLSPRLIIHTATKPQSTSLAGSSSWTIGRGKESRIVLPDRWISRKHAILQVVDDVEVYLIDLGSRNGSFINGQRITVPTLLQHGDRIDMGKSGLEFQCYPVLPSPRLVTPSAAQTVAITHSDAVVRQVWQEVLVSQGIHVAEESTPEQLEQCLQQWTSRGRSPNLWLLGIEALIQPDAVEFDTSSFFQQCHALFPNLHIFLLGQEMQYSVLQRQSFLKNGALELILPFPIDNLAAHGAEIAARLTLVLRALERSLDQPALSSTLLSLQATLSSDRSPKALEPFIEL